MADRFHKDSGVITESGGWRHKCGYGEKERDSTGCKKYVY